MSLPSVYECPPALFRCRLVANNALSIRDATVRIPPTIAHVLYEINSCQNLAREIERDEAYDVRKCANDWRVSWWTINMGEIS